MKYFILTIALIIVSSFSRGNFQEDTLKVKDSIVSLAIDKTDKQVDSIFANTPKPITFNDLNEGFSGIIQHIDSLNATGIILMRQRDSIEGVRHNEYLAKMKIIETNTQLRKENKALSKTKEWAEKGSHVLMVFITVFAAIQFSRGVDKGIRKMKNASR